MTISFDKALGMHAHALNLRGQRATILAANLANADTPGYKARDMDFKKALAAAGGQGIQLKTTHSGHMDPRERAGSELLYRVPKQPSIDGNTVDMQVEQSSFLRNALEYQASLRFVSGKFRGLKTAIRGN